MKINCENFYANFDVLLIGDSASCIKKENRCLAGEKVPKKQGRSQVTD